MKKYPSKDTQSLNASGSTKSRKADNRSIVEILGVLIVMVILIISGITGYKMTITKWRINETVNELNTRGHTYLKALEQTGTIVSDKFKTSTRTGYLVLVALENKKLKLTLNGVEKEVCKGLINNSWPLAKEIYIGNKPATENNCSQASTSGLVFILDSKAYVAGSDNNMKRTTTTLYETITAYNKEEVNTTFLEITTTPKECIKDSECDRGYCDIHNGCEDPTEKGSCLAIHAKEAVVVGPKTFKQSQEDMSWWTAKRWCENQGMQLVSLEDIGCTATYEYCTSTTLSTLRDQGVSKYFWTRHESDSCNAWIVFNFNYVYYRNRSNFGTALCVTE